MNTVSIVIAGVGGQGTVLAGQILGSVLAENVPDVKIGEVHGMSQRGGSVVTFVRYGDRVYAPSVDQGEADILLAFEQLEALRMAHCLKKGGRLIMGLERILPQSVLTGAENYPADIPERLSEMCDVTAVDAAALAKEAGSELAANIVLLGALSRFLPFDIGSWERAIRSNVKERFLEIDLKAFELGREGVR